MGRAGVRAMEGPSPLVWSSVFLSFPSHRPRVCSVGFTTGCGGASVFCWVRTQVWGCECARHVLRWRAGEQPTSVHAACVPRPCCGPGSWQVWSLGSIGCRLGGLVYEGLGRRGQLGNPESFGVSCAGGRSPSGVAGVGAEGSAPMPSWRTRQDQLGSRDTELGLELRGCGPRGLGGWPGRRRQTVWGCRSERGAGVRAAPLSPEATGRGWPLQQDTEAPARHPGHRQELSLVTLACQAHPLIPVSVPGAQRRPRRLRRGAGGS